MLINPILASSARRRMRSWKTPLILLLFGALLGRAVCAFLCPFGLIQELLYKIPTKKLKESAWTRRLTVIKYIVLVVMVINRATRSAAASTSTMVRSSSVAGEYSAAARTR